MTFTRTQIAVFSCILMLLVPMSTIGIAANSQSTTPTITIDGPDSIAVNDSEQQQLVATNVDNSDDLGSYKVNISYDPAVVSLSAASTPYFTIQSSTSQQGVLTIVGYTDATKTPDGTLALAQLTIHGKTTASTDLTITVESLSDTDGHSVTHSVQNVSIAVTSEQSTTTTSSSTTTTTTTSSSTTTTTTSSTTTTTALPSTTTIASTTTSGKSGSGSGGGGGGGGGANVPPPPVQVKTMQKGPAAVTATITSARKTKPGRVSLSGSGFSKNGVSFDTLSVKPKSTDALARFELTVRALSNTPKQIPAVPNADTTLAYLEVSKEWITNEEIDTGKFHFTVDSTTIDEFGGSPQNIALYRYHDGTWNRLDTVVKRKRGGTYHFTATTPGFSVFAVGATQASFELTKSSIGKTSVSVGEPLTVSTVVTNTGTGPGTYTAKLQVDGSVVNTTQVTLNSSERTTITFTHPINQSGEHTLAINGQSIGEVTVTETDAETGQTPTATTSSQATSQLSASTTTDQSSPLTETPEDSEQTVIPYGVILVVAALGALYFLRIRT